MIFAGQPTRFGIALPLASSRTGAGGDSEVCDGEGTPMTHLFTVLAEWLSPETAGSILHVLPQVVALGARPPAAFLDMLAREALGQWSALQPAQSCAHCGRCDSTTCAPAGCTAASPGAQQSPGACCAPAAAACIVPAAVTTATAATPATALAQPALQLPFEPVVPDRRGRRRTVPTTAPKDSRASRALLLELLQAEWRRRRTAEEAAAAVSKRADALPAGSSIVAGGRSHTFASHNPQYIDPQPAPPFLAAVPTCASTSTAAASSEGGRVSSPAAAWSPTQFLQLLHAAHVLECLDERTFVRLVQEAVKQDCAREAWAAWTTMRRMGMPAAHDDVILKRLFPVFVGGGLYRPSWEVLRLLDGQRRGTLPSISELHRLAADARQQRAAWSPVAGRELAPGAAHSAADASAPAATAAQPPAVSFKDDGVWMMASADSADAATAHAAALPLASGSSVMLASTVDATAPLAAGLVRRVASSPSDGYFEWTLLEPVAVLSLARADLAALGSDVAPSVIASLRCSGGVCDAVLRHATAACAGASAGEWSVALTAVPCSASFHAAPRASSDKAGASDVSLRHPVQLPAALRKDLRAAAQQLARSDDVQPAVAFYVRVRLPAIASDPVAIVDSVATRLASAFTSVWQPFSVSTTSGSVAPQSAAVLHSPSVGMRLVARQGMRALLGVEAAADGDASSKWVAAGPLPHAASDSSPAALLDRSLHARVIFVGNSLGLPPSAPASGAPAEELQRTFLGHLHADAAFEATLASLRSTGVEVHVRLREQIGASRSAASRFFQLDAQFLLASALSPAELLAARERLAGMSEHARLRKLGVHDAVTAMEAVAQKAWKATAGGSSALLHASSNAAMVHDAVAKPLRPWQQRLVAAAQSASPATVSQTQPAPHKPTDAATPPAPASNSDGRKDSAAVAPASRASAALPRAESAGLPPAKQPHRRPQACAVPPKRALSPAAAKRQSASAAVAAILERAVAAASQRNGVPGAGAATKLE